VSHPTPLHPDADLAVVLDDLRQSVAAWGDEGLVMRFFRASICLMLLGILDTLIELLADFRAGRLPPLLPAVDESSALPSVRGGGDSSTIAAPRDTPSPQDRAAHGVRAPCRDIADAPHDAPAEVPDQTAADDVGVARRHAELPRSPPRLPQRQPAPVPRVLAWYPSQIPRAPSEKFGGPSAAPLHVHFVTISE
jgi:hypothetical protein